MSPLPKFELGPRPKQPSVKKYSSNQIAPEDFKIANVRNVNDLDVSDSVSPLAYPLAVAATNLR